MKSLLSKPAFWITVIILIMGIRYAYTRRNRSKLIARIEERFGNMPGLHEKTSEELQQILSAK